MSHTEKLREVSEGFVNERDNLLSKYEVSKTVLHYYQCVMMVEPGDGKREGSC